MWDRHVLALHARCLSCHRVKRLWHNLVHLKMPTLRALRRRVDRMGWALRRELLLEHWQYSCALPTLEALPPFILKHAQAMHVVASAFMDFTMGAWTTHDEGCMHHARGVAPERVHLLFADTTSGLLDPFWLLMAMVLPSSTRHGAYRIHSLRQWQRAACLEMPLQTLEEMYRAAVALERHSAGALGLATGWIMDADAALFLRRLQQTHAAEDALGAIGITALPDAAKELCAAHGIFTVRQLLHTPVPGLPPSAATALKELRDAKTFDHAARRLFPHGSAAYYELLRGALD